MFNLVALAARYGPVERLVGIVEGHEPPMYLCSIQTLVKNNACYTSVLVGLPRQQHVQSIFRHADFAQVLYAVIVLVAIDMIYSLCGQLVVAQRPDNAVNK